MCCFEGDDEVRVFLTRETGKQMSRGGTKTLGDRHGYCSIWLRPGNRRGFAGREGKVRLLRCVLEEKGRKGEREGSPLSCRTSPLTYPFQVLSVCLSFQQRGGH